MALGKVALPDYAKGFSFCVDKKPIAWVAKAVDGEETVCCVLIAGNIGIVGIA